MKDEISVVPLESCVGLKFQLYSFITEDKHKSKKAKGINKNIVDDELKYKDYKITCFAQ